MEVIVETKAAREISMTRRGANQHSHVIMRKSLHQPAEKKTAPISQPENDDMDVNVMKAIAAMTDVTRNYFAGLEDEAAKAFIAKPIAEQAAEAKKAFDDAEATKKTSEEAEAAKKAGETDVHKRLENVEKENEVLKANAARAERTSTLRKTAENSSFIGYPGGVEAVTKRLESIDALPEETKKGIIDDMKSQASMAKRIGSIEFGDRSPEELMKSAPATAQIEKKVKEVMAEKGITRAAALGEVVAMQAFKGLYAEALAEEGSL